MANTKNMGQVAGLSIGQTAPSNTALIWYDNTPSQMTHKVYNFKTGLWGALDPEIVSVITYSELVNAAKVNGLPIGKFYQITDRSNVLAFAITTTKVQYSDTLGNILIDDLGTNIQYHVSSSNLLIDDLQGTFDEVNKRLVFRFNEYVPVFNTDYIFGKSRVGNAWALAKYKISSFLSTVTGNSITWNGGFFFNFSQSLRDQFDKKGGVVSKDTYDTDMEEINTSINNVGKENQQIITNAENLVTEATAATAIYGKQIPTAPVISGAPGDVLINDTLTTIVSKFQRWINQFKYATGILLSKNYADAKQNEYVNNNDNVETAIGKLQKQVKDIGTGSLTEVAKKVEFDYVVDSDAALTGLINNANATSVLIKNGTWKLNSPALSNIIRLHENTKYIYAEPNAVIQVIVDLTEATAANSIILLTYLGDKQLFSADNLQIELSTINTPNPPITISFSVITYYNLSNLRNCTCRRIAPFYSLANWIGFSHCEHLTDCWAQNQQFSTMFRNCKYMRGCIHNYQGSTSPGTFCLYCDYVSDSGVIFDVTTADQQTPSLFFQSNNLVNCFAHGTMLRSSYYFNGCYFVSNCEVKIETDTAGVEGFAGCYHVNNCRVYKNKNLSTDNAKGFSGCKEIHGCAVSSNIGTANAYFGSYASYTVVADNAAADTANGGFNSIYAMNA